MILSPWSQIMLKVVIMMATMCSGVAVVRPNYPSGLNVGLNVWRTH